MHIVLFGGAFDPPHWGHHQIISALLDQEIADQVWLVPVWEHPWAKEYNKQVMTDYQQRVEMLNLLIDHHFLKPHLSVPKPSSPHKNKIKIAHYKNVSFTYPTLKFFEKKYPQHTFSWVMGSEYISRFDQFLKTHPQLIDYQFYIYPRAGFPIQDLYPNMQALDSPQIEVSSSMIRDAVKKNQSIKKLLPPEISSFVGELGLYSI